MDAFNHDLYLHIPHDEALLSVQEVVTHFIVVSFYIKWVTTS